MGNYNFITAFIISFVACYFLKTFNLTDVLHIGNLFGIYFLAVYGIDILVEGGKVQNNHERFLYAIGFIVIFDILFVLLIPLFFGPNSFSVVDYLTVVFNGAQIDLILNTPVYLAIFAILILIFNFILYRHDKIREGIYNELE